MSSGDEELNDANWADSVRIDWDGVGHSHADEQKLLSPQQRQALAKKARRYETRQSINNALNFKKKLHSEHLHTNGAIAGTTLLAVVLSGTVVFSLERVLHDSAPSPAIANTVPLTSFIVQAALGQPRVLAELERQAKIYNDSKLTSIASIYLTAAVAEKDLLIKQPSLRACPAPNEGTIMSPGDVATTSVDTLAYSELVTNIDIVPGLVQYSPAG
jgi:hypothetical protein